jgi:hypothetical protein
MPVGHARVSTTFEWLFVIFAAWQVLGAYVDGWAHLHLKTALESFFTPWHAIFYLGFGAVTALLVVTLVRNHRAGYAWKHALPREYLLALCGSALFLVSGVGDMLWHIIFGIEIGIDALLSPTHLLLAFAGAVIASAPLHAIWFRNRTEERIHKGPVVISLCLLVLTLTFMMQFLHPYYYDYTAAASYVEGPLYEDISIAHVLVGVTIANIIFFVAIILGVTLAIIRFIDLPPGTFTLLFFVEAVAMAALMEQYWFIGSAIISGVLIDVCYQKLLHHLHEVRSLRLFGVLLPVLITAPYFLATVIRSGTWWSIHLVAGTVCVAGIAGLLLTYLILPPGDHFVPHRKW